MITASDRVRARPNTIAAEMIEGRSPTGVVNYATVDDDGRESLMITLDSGETVWSISFSDWEVIEGSAGEPP